jgi:hypothetical protein
MFANTRFRVLGLGTRVLWLEVLSTSPKPLIFLLSARGGSVYDRKFTRRFVLSHIIPKEIFTIHGDIYTLW